MVTGPYSGYLRKALWRTGIWFEMQAEIQRSREATDLKQTEAPEARPGWKQAWEVGGRKCQVTWSTHEEGEGGARGV